MDIIRHFPPCAKTVHMVYFSRNLIFSKAREVLNSASGPKTIMVSTEQKKHMTSVICWSLAPNFSGMGEAIRLIKR